MTSRESTTLISPTHTLEADRVSLPLQMLSTSPVIAQMMTICNIEECSLFAYDTFMVKLVNACLPLLSCSSAIHFAIFSKYRDTYRIATQVSRYVSWGYRIVTPLPVVGRRPQYIPAAYSCSNVICITKNIIYVERQKHVAYVSKPMKCSMI